MRMPQKFISAVSAVAILLSAPVVMSSAANASEASAIDEGKKIAFHRKKGNCLACHAIADGKLPGNIGPPLVNMKDRFPDKSKLKDQIWDATANNPNSIMPPFGKHNILSKDELDKVVDFIYSL
ncbi:MAG: sulfur oxidation c-type cytochrome SoxX [Gammaproteobacteria bacterium]|nr:sulfur oxidation c-type cytochrome SoxX [Gammaproteobacteria bacterium]